MNLAQSVAEFRHHATAARRMVARRNRAFVASNYDRAAVVWPHRSLELNIGHTETANAVLRDLREHGYDEVAEALRMEAAALSRLSWKRIENPRGTIPRDLSVTLSHVRRTVAAAIH